MEQNLTTTIANAEANPMAAGERLAALSSLLDNLESLSPSPAVAHDNRLVQARLGMAAGLFRALRAKHAATAAHCLRVALGCSAWSLQLKLGDEQRDPIEVAALLHDVGKIGIPDHMLLKPGKLVGDELTVVGLHSRIGLEILSGCCVSPATLDIVHYAGAWYDGGKTGFDRAGDDLPFGARMVAIVDAFDSMTTDHVYRPAMSRERAMAELFEFAGTQFDPRLVEQFYQQLVSDGIGPNAQVARRWLRQLQAENSNEFWGLNEAVASVGGPSQDNAFHEKLLDSMHDAVVFVDAQLQILLWNRAAERLTGIKADSVKNKRWLPSLVGLRDETGEPISESACPIAHAVHSGVQTYRRMSIAGRHQTALSVDFHLTPVIGRAGEPRGATVLLHDASRQITLEERVQSLHEKATRDPLTKVYNRAEFDRVHEQFVETHLQERLPCSLIICDIDHFKSVNDNYGHQAGDDVLVCFGALLQRHCRQGDLVARYGGEEFVMLCADCDNAAATNRAEDIRRQLAELPQHVLGGRPVTASFGVTEIQGGDTPETMLRRADRALYQAKENGRNMVVQLGSGIHGEEKPATSAGWFSWFRRTPPDQLLERKLITPVPLKIVIEKLRGFVADHYAEVQSIDESRVVLRIDGQNTPMLRRASDRAVPFYIELQFEETEEQLAHRGGRTESRTVIRVAIRPKRKRDRRKRDVMERARQLLMSLKSYLMAHDHLESRIVQGVEESEDSGVIQKARSLLTNLWGSKN